MPKVKIAANGDYNFSGERYRESSILNNTFPLVELGEVCKIKGGYAFPSSDFVEKGIQLIRMGNVKRMFFDHKNSPVFLSDSVKSNYQNYLLKKGDILISMTGTIGKKDYGNVCMIDIEGDFLLNQRVGKIEVNTLKLDPRFIYYIAQSNPFRTSLFSNSSGGVRQANISSKGIENIKIPLPPIAIQQEIVTEIEGYQKVINGARAVIDNYRPHIPINPDWAIVEFGEICKPEYGFTEKAMEQGDVRFIRITDISESGFLKTEDQKYIMLTQDARNSLLSKGDILVARTGATFGKTMLFEEEYEAVFASYLIRLRFPKEKVNPKYYWVFAQSDDYWKQANALMTGGGQPQFNGNALVQIKFPLPPLEIQKAIVAEIEAEQTLVNANRELITRFEKKIQTTLNRIWGEEEKPVLED